VSSARGLHYTYAQYLEALERSELKLEYYDGDIFAMAGGTPEHGIVAGALTVLVGKQLPPSCRVLTSDVKVRVPATGLSTYPDFAVVCGPLQRAADDANSVTNPVLIAEVLSPSTEDYDRGEKLSHYKQLSSLQTVLLVAHDTRRVTAVRRSGDRWLVTDYRDGETVERTTPPVQVPVRELYAVLDSL
jgi:Uma2 family endonuclease